MSVRTGRPVGVRVKPPTKRRSASLSRHRRSIGLARATKPIIASTGDRLIPRGAFSETPVPSLMRNVPVVEPLTVSAMASRALLGQRCGCGLDAVPIAGGDGGVDGVGVLLASPAKPVASGRLLVFQ